MKKNLFAIFASLLMVASISAGAQNVKVSGTVSDANGPLVGAVVMVKGTSNGTATDIDGKYSLTADAKDVLEFSCLGYQTKEQNVNGRSEISVILAEDTQMLQDVVVLGYGAATKKKDLSAAVGIVASPEQLAKAPVTSTQAMLQGQIPGVTVTNDGGAPTSTPSVVIRGQGSKNGDGVLWVVDGVPGAPINSLNDIESIVVLKDAASAAIYGAQSGAGGVILVTTKRAQKGVSVSYDGLVGVRSAYNLITPLDAQQQIDITKLAYQNAGQVMPDAWNVENNPYIATTRTNWMKEVFRDALYHRHNVVFNGGTDKFKNRLSFSLDNNEGVITGTYSNKLSVNYKGEFQFNKWLKFTEDLSWGTSDGRSCNTDGATSGVVTLALCMPSSASKTPSYYNPTTGEYTYAAEGFGGTTIEDPAYTNIYGDLHGIHGIVRNPLHDLLGSNQKNQYNRFYTSSALEFANLVKGLKFISRFTYSTGNSLNKSFSPKILECGSPSYTNSLSYSASRDHNWKTENTLTFDRTFGKHSVGALLATTADHSWGSGFNVNESGFDDESAYLQYLQFGTTSYLSAGDWYSGDDANVALIARLSYSFDDRYFVTASWRRDYAGRLPEGHNYGDFPAVTGAWKISSEPFFNKTSAVTLLKLRASWGRIGNLGSIGWNYKSNNLYSNFSNKHAYYDVTNSSATRGAQFYNGRALNTELTWETSEQINVGFDAGFLNDRLTASIDGYYKRTYNLIQGQTMDWPSSIGVDAKTINLGQISNRGIEISLGWQDKVGDWSYYINGNAAYNKNRVDNIGVTDANGNSAVWTAQDQWRDVWFYNYSREGGELREFYLIKCLGIFQSWEDIYEHSKDGKLIQPNAQPGDLKFEDFNNDGRISAEDRQYLGNSTPDITYALNLGFTWKDLSVSAQFYGVQGAQAVHCSKMAEVSMSSKVHNRSSQILNAWTENNRTSNIPRISKSDDNSNFMAGSSWYLEDSSFCRLKNLTVTYDFTRLLRKVNHFGERGSSASLFFSGENLFTITKYTGMDPECGEYDFLKYPVSRVLSVGVKLTY